MCKPSPLNPHPRHQQGFVLFMVLIMMMVIALLVVAATQSYHTEQRISANDSDRKLAITLAEAALHQGKMRIMDFDEHTTTTFTEDCIKGLCTAIHSISPNKHIIVKGAPSQSAWTRKCGKNLCIEVNGTEYAVGYGLNLPKNPRYIIEYLNTSDSGAAVYRITAKAWGKNSNTSVMIQAYVSDGENL